MTEKRMKQPADLTPLEPEDHAYAIYTYLRYEWELQNGL